jgi:hypothetical protein
MEPPSYHLWSQELGAATAILLAVWLEATAATPQNDNQANEAKATVPFSPPEVLKLLMFEVRATLECFMNLLANIFVIYTNCKILLYISFLLFVNVLFTFKSSRSL